MKSLFASLKKELVHHGDYATVETAKASASEDLGVFYDRIRRHSVLGYVARAEFECSEHPRLRVRFSWGTPDLDGVRGHRTPGIDGHGMYRDFDAAVSIPVAGWSMSVGIEIETTGADGGARCRLRMSVHYPTTHSSQTTAPKLKRSPV